MSADAFVQALSRRMRARDLTWAASVALFAGALLGAAAQAVASVLAAGAVAAGTALLTFGAAVTWRRASWTTSAVAQFAEARLPGLDNLLVTAVSGATMAELSPVIREEVRRQAEARLAPHRPDALSPVLPAVAALVAALVLAVAVVAWPGREERVPSRADGSPGTAAGGVFDVEATVTPPAYLRMEPQTSRDPRDVVLPAGSTLRVRVRTDLAAVAFEDATTTASTFARDAASGAFERTWTPAASTTAALVGRDGEGAAAVSRLLTLTVVPDRRPTVRVTQPGRDLRLASADTPIDLRVEADDDHGIAALELRFVRIAGSGESFTFDEGRVPLTDLVRTGTGVQARLSWSLRPLALEAGESLVYRVVARDDAPGQPPGESESYTIDIGKAYETTGAGAAVAEEDRRYAISQQMVIVHTERALAERGTASDDAWLARTQAIAAEQRMVRAEVVFLGGGEVEDEVEEAARGDELQEGRLENRGRAEMLRAIGEMSRAEARLTAGDAKGALVFERQALAALLKAFDRRRYFLRTVPERARIDMARRLSGDRRTASPGPRDAAERDDPLALERTLLLDLAAADDAAALGPLAARVAAIVPGDATWSRLAARLLEAREMTARRAAVAEVAAAVRARVQGRLPAAPGPAAVPRDYLDGLWRSERRAGSSK